MKRKQDMTIYIMAAIGIIPVIWLGLLIAPLFRPGKFNLDTFYYAVDNPFTVILSPSTLPTVLAVLAIYAFAVFYFKLTRKNTRPGDHGDAQWGNPRAINRKFQDKESDNNMIFTSKVQMRLDGRVQGLNAFCLVFGGPGTGKSRSYVMPNLMQMAGSYVVLDSKGELLETTGKMFKDNGYVVKVFNCIDPRKGDFFNPFVYIRNDEELESLAHDLFKNTTPKNSSKEDAFFEDMAEFLLIALMYVVYYEAPPEEMNFGTVNEMFGYIEFREEDENYRSTMHKFFEKLEHDKPGHPALEYWNKVIAGAGKTGKSILVSLGRHLAKFGNVAIRNMLSMDTLELTKIGERKTVIFCEIPDRDKSTNFLVSMLYSSLFNEIYYCADVTHSDEGRRLPVRVTFLMDEFANVAVPDDFTNILTTIRSRNVSIAMMLQDLSQFETKFKKPEMQTIISSCDEILYLGSNSIETIEYMSKYLGEETIETESYGETKGASGSNSVNTSKIGFKLLSIPGFRKLHIKKALLLIRGEDPIIDFKFDPCKHKNAKQTTLLGNKENGYKYDESSAASIMFIDPETYISDGTPVKDIEMPTEEAIEEYTTYDAESWLRKHPIISK